MAVLQKKHNRMLDWNDVVEVDELIEDVNIEEDDVLGLFVSPLHSVDDKTGVVVVSYIS